MRTSGTSRNVSNNKSLLDRELDKFSEEGSFEESEIDWDEDIQPDVDWEKSIEEHTEGVKEVEDVINESLPKPTTGRIVLTVMLGIIFSAILGVLIYGLYMSYIKYPPQMKIVKEETGIYCLNNWEKDLKSMKSLGKDSYIAQEIDYANGNKNKIDFYKKMLATVKYSPKEVPKKNIYGNDYIDRKTNEVVYENSWVSEGEKVNLSYVDYTKIEIDEITLAKVLSESGVTFGDTDYENRLVDVFCKYMNTLTIDSIPTKTVDYVPSMIKNNSKFTILQDEDVNIDKLLFSSKEFYDLLDRFSVVAAKISKGVEITTLDGWNKWNALSDEDKAKQPEPSKYNYKEVLNKTWCGVYYLKNEYETADANGKTVKGINAQLGDGTFKNPAGLNTGIITYIQEKITNKKGKEVIKKYPIKVSMLEYGVSEDAIKWFEGKDLKNRGIDITSEIQYCYYVFQVTNLSNKTLTISDNSSICDANENNAPRTGSIYGLQTTITLQPDQKGIIESWNRSTELNTKYVIWGKDYNRTQEPIWFRVLAGDIDDPSEDKGVTINKSRHSNDSDDEITDSEN